MRYYLFLKELIKIGLIAILPILLVIQFSWDGIIPIVIYLQLILIWAQAEIGLRQHTFSLAQFDPSFKIEIEKEVETIYDEKCPNKITITNVSEHPAYNIMSGRILDERFKPVPPNKRKEEIKYDTIDCLPKNESVLLCRVSDNLINNKWIIEVSYTNKFNVFRDCYIRFREDRKHIFIPGDMKVPGILLNTFDNLVLCYKLMRANLKAK